MYNNVYLNTNTPKLLEIARRVLTNVKVITMATSDYTSKDKKRFWSKVEISIKNNQCWEWQAGHNSDGYGRFWCNNKTRQAHCIAWELFNHKSSNGLCVLHSCDNPNCVNPEHLSLGTNLDNSRDMVEKGRQSKGEKNGNCKLTGKEVSEIRKRYANEFVTLAALGREYNVSYVQIAYIVKHKGWKEIK